MNTCFSGSCDFGYDLCGWFNDVNDHFDWIQWRGENGEGGPPGDRGKTIIDTDLSVIKYLRLSACFDNCLKRSLKYCKPTSIIIL